MLRIDFLGGYLWDCRSRFARTSSQEGSLPKAFHFVTGFVANIGASLEEFAGDVRAILELTINSK